MNKGMRELLQLSDSELVEKLSILRKQLYEFMCKAKLGTLDSPGKIRVTKKKIARILTLLSNKKDVQEEKTKG